MPLQRVRRTGLRQSLRAAVRPRALLGLLHGIAVAAVIAAAGYVLHLPEALTRVVGTGIAIPALVARQMRRADERAWRAEQLLPRRPRELNPASVPRLQPADLQQPRRMLRLDVGLALLLVGLVVAAEWFLLTHSGPDGAHLGPWAALLGPAGLAVVFAVELPPLLRARRQLRSLDSAMMPRHAVRVIGFTGNQNMEVAIAPLEPGVHGDGSPLAVEIRGWHTRDIVYGDLLVCDGEPRPGAILRVSTPDGAGWTWKVRALTDDERAPGGPPVSPAGPR